MVQITSASYALQFLFSTSVTGVSVTTEYILEVWKNNNKNEYCEDVNSTVTENCEDEV